MRLDEENVKNNIPQITDNGIKFAKCCCETQIYLWEKKSHSNRTHDVCLFKQNFMVKPLLDADGDTLPNKTRMEMVCLNVRFYGTCFENCALVYFCLHDGTCSTSV